MRFIVVFVVCLSCALLAPNSTTNSNKNATQNQSYAEELNVLYEALKQKHKTKEKPKGNFNNYRKNAPPHPV